MNRYVLNKVIAIISLICLLLVAVKVVNNLIAERESYQQKVIRDISQSTSGAQTVMGPVLVIPYEAAITVTDPQTGQRSVQAKPLEHYILPQTLQVEALANVEPRKLGIYQAQIYSAELNFGGRFTDISDLDKIKNRSDFIRFNEPYAVFLVADSRGIIGTSAFEFDGKIFNVQENQKSDAREQAIYIPMNIDDVLRASDKREFSFKLGVQGTQNLSVIPLGKDSTMALTSNWRHPSFIGAMLPKKHTVGKTGFSANWQSTWSANHINNEVGKLSLDKMNSLPAFSVNMMQTVTQYQRIERTLKYAILFIGLTFICFVSFEAFSKLRIHPIQYTLVGVTLIMFYLLLLALSEHTGFNLAYGIAAVCSCGLIGLYLGSVLKGALRGMGFAAGLLGLYGTLFIILRSEDMALLLGTCLLFIILAALMLLTRKVDWYQVTDALGFKKNQSAEPKTQSSTELNTAPPLQNTPS